MARAASILALLIYCHIAYCRFRVTPPRCSFTQAPQDCKSADVYRSIDGSCNNPFNPVWGQCLRPHIRLMKAEYGAQESMRTKSVTGKDLPSPRKVSTTILSVADRSSLSRKITNMLWLYGQFIDHDLTLTTQEELKPCCDGHSSEACIPISIPEDDPFWARRGRKCMNLVRSTGVKRGDCGVPHREQLNANTPMIDASAVYGSTITQAKYLRKLRDGLLKISADGSLPLETPNSECAIPKTERDQRCFAGGDLRASEWHGLTSIHTMFVRLHNKIATELSSQIKPMRLPKMVEDEMLYQEARKIVGGIVQIITYRDFLPIVMGEGQMRKHKLDLGSYRYNPHINPSISNAFATAAYRFGHSLIRDDTRPMNKLFHHKRAISLKDSFFQPSAYRRAGQNDTIRGLCLEAANNMDEHFSTELTRHLFEKTFDGLGNDLPAMNAQRGREHGLPSYNKFRRHCRLQTITSFHHMPDHKHSVAQRFAKVYDHPDDIDLFFGGVTEKPVPGGLVGPTFACIIGEQFKRLKDGDRFWHENYFHKHSFTPAQIEKLKLISLAKIICYTTDSDRITENVFLLHSRMTTCDRLSGVDFTNWLTNDQVSLVKSMERYTRKELGDMQTTAPQLSSPPKLYVFGAFEVH